MISFSGRHSLPRFGIYNMTKHSLVAFTDTLRRELYNLSVKVSSIEPGGFKTRLTSDDHVEQLITKTWKQSSDEVKTFYGCPDQCKKLMLNTLHLAPLENNLDVCVDDIIDAITNRRPKLIYRPMNRSSRLISIPFTYYPPQIVDWICNSVDNYLKNK